MSCVLQRGHSCDGCDLASTLCKYDLRKGDFFIRNTFIEKIQQIYIYIYMTL